MSNIYTIYKATNTHNGKIYVGFDSSWPKRKSEHKSAARRGEPYKFYNAIRKYGWDSFVWEIVYQSIDYDHCLNSMEPYFIVEYNSLVNGYNGNAGGKCGAFGSSWWNNGTSQSFSQAPPDDSYVKGRLQFNNTGAKIGAEVNRNRRWINNGKNEIMIQKTDLIPPGWITGRLKTTFGHGTRQHSTTGTKWWNNGIIQKMTSESPGDAWVKGRLLQPTHLR